MEQSAWNVVVSDVHGNLCADQVGALCEHFLSCCRCEATYTRVLAEQLGTKLDVNACCPGYVDTDMSSHRGIKTPLQGADTPVWLALLAPKGTSGKFFSDRHEEAF